MRHSILALTLLPLAACTVSQSDATATSTPGGACRSEPLAQFIGQQASEEVGARILKASGSRVIRWVPKGGVVTMDFRADRVTVQLDGQNRIETASCG